MKKVLKIAGISLLSLLLLVVVVASTAVIVVFNTNLVTSVVNKKAADFLSCDYHIQSIEPVFFKTFPQFSLQIKGLYLQDAMPESETDTLAYIASLTATVDVKALLKDQELKLKELLLDQAQANVYVHQDGRANYDIFRFGEDSISEEVDTTSLSLPFAEIDADRIEINKLNVNYVDSSSKILARLCDFDFNAAIHMKDERLQCRLNMLSPSLTFALNDTFLLDAQPVSFSLPLALDLPSWRADVQALQFSVGKIALMMNGWLALDSATQAISTDLNVQLGGNQEPIAHYLQLIPPAYASLLEDIRVDGLLALKARVQGCYHENQMPLVDVDVQLADACFSYPDLPQVDDIQANVSAHIDLNEPAQSTAHLQQISLRANNSKLQASAQVNKLLDDNPYLNAQAMLEAPLAAWQDFLPDSLTVCGDVKLQARTAFALNDLQNLNSLNGINLDAQVDYRQLEVAMSDLQARSASGSLKLNTPKQKNVHPIHLKLCDISSLEVNISDTIHAALQQFNVDVQLSDVLKDMEKVKAKLQVDLGKAKLAMSQSLSAQLQAFSLGADAFVRGDNYQTIDLDLNLSNQALQANLQAAHQISTEAVNLNLFIEDGLLSEDVLHTLKPSLSLYLQSADVKTNLLPEEVQLDDIQFSYTEDKLQIQKSSVNLGNSDFHLVGHMSNIIAFLDNEDLLKAELDFVSNHTDVNRLMELTSGLGSDSTDLTVNEEDELRIDVEEDSSLNEPNPFIVPKGIDFLLRTDIKEAVVGKQLATNLSGNLYVRDGVMILEEMGFVCDAAKLRLTAMYRSPRPNHLYLGLDYHMVDIQIDELLQMLPQVDSVLPMLKAFKGGAEFHIAAETYLNARYELKKSTLRGATSIQGQDLVVMDSEQFSEIAKILRFNKQTENRIDTLNAEITVFRNEVDIYPIQLSIDKYKAIVGGRHNLDMSFNYHASLVSPLRLGVDVSGTFDDLKIRPVACRYTDQFRPAERRLLEQQQLSLRKIIQESLIKDL